MQALMTVAEDAPSTEVIVDLDAMTVRAGAQTYAMTLPAPARDAFLSGTWDATALLLSDFDEVRSVANRLPYVSGWR